MHSQRIFTQRIFRSYFGGLFGNTTTNALALDYSLDKIVGGFYLFTSSLLGFSLFFAGICFYLIMWVFFDFLCFTLIPLIWFHIGIVLLYILCFFFHFTEFRYIF